MHSSQATEDKSSVGANIFAQPLSIFGLPVDRDTIFSNHKRIYKQRVEKRQRKLIVKVTNLKTFLQPGECIRCLTTGYSPLSVIEQILTGPAFLFFKRAMFVFTDRRILHVRTSFNRKAGNSVSQILYEDCSAILMKGRSLVVSYKNGEKEIFNYIGRREKKKIKALIDELPLKLKAPAVFKSRVALCPECAHALKPRSLVCEACNLEFKSSLKAKVLSLTTPGGGYLYCNHLILGSVAAVLEIGSIGYMIMQGLDFRKGLPLNWNLLAVAAGVLILVKVIATFHSTQMTLDQIPRSGDFTIRKS